MGGVETQEDLAVARWRAAVLQVVNDWLTDLWYQWEGRIPPCLASAYMDQTFLPVDVVQA